MYAHKLTTIVESDHTKTVYCSVCGQDQELNRPCPGPVTFDEQFNMVFGSKATKYGSKFLKEVLDSQK